MGVHREPLSARAEIIRGVTFSRRDAQNEPNDGYVPVLRAGNIQNSLLLDSDLVFVPRALVSERQRLRRGDIVMCTSSGSANIVGKSAFSFQDWDGSFGAFCAVIRAKDESCDERYLYHYLQSPDFRHWAQNSSGINIKNIRKSELDALEIPFPDLEQQQRLAAILDKADAIHRKREESLRLADEFLKSAFLEMFGDPVKNPKGWELVAIGDVCERVTVGIVVKPASYYVSQGVPALRSLNVKEGHIDQENLVYFTEADNKTKLHKTRIWQGDVVVVRSGQPGKAAIVPIDLDGANAIDILITTPRKKLISSPYLCSILNSPAGRRLVLAEERGQIQKHLNVKSLKESKIPLPPLNQVEKFTEIFEQVEMSKKALELASIEAENLASSLYQRAFRGEL